MSAILMFVKMSMNGVGFLSTYFSIGDHKIFPLGWLIGAGLMLLSISIPEDLKK